MRVRVGGEGDWSHIPLFCHTPNAASPASLAPCFPALGKRAWGLSGEKPPVCALAHRLVLGVAQGGPPCLLPSPLCPLPHTFTFLLLRTSPSAYQMLDPLKVKKPVFLSCFPFHFSGFLPPILQRFVYVPVVASSAHTLQSGLAPHPRQRLLAFLGSPQSWAQSAASGMLTSSSHGAPQPGPLLLRDPLSSSILGFAAFFLPRTSLGEAPGLQPAAPLLFCLQPLWLRGRPAQPGAVGGLPGSGFPACNCHSVSICRLHS